MQLFGQEAGLGVVQWLMLLVLFAVVIFGLVVFAVIDALSSASGFSPLPPARASASSICWA